MTASSIVLRSLAREARATATVVTVAFFAVRVLQNLKFGERRLDMAHSDPRFPEPLQLDSDEALIREARVRALEFNIVVSQRDSGKYVGFAREFPRHFGIGGSVEECFHKTRDAIVGAVALSMKLGEPIPEPVRDLRRHEQVNIRLTIEEKAMLQAAADADGARSLSDFVRELCLTASRGRDRSAGAA